MSYPQTTKREEPAYFDALYDQNKTAKFLKNGSRIGILQGTPAAFNVLTCSQLNAGTYTSPDILSFQPLSGPTSAIRSVIQVGGPFPAVTLPVNATTITNIPVITDQGFNVIAGSGQIFQTFENGRTYLAEASFTLQQNVGDVGAEIRFSLNYFDASTGQTVILASQNMLRQAPAIPTTQSRGVSLAGAVVGTNPTNSYFFCTWQTVNSLVDATNIVLNTVRIQVTVR